MADWKFGASFIKPGEAGLSRATTDVAHLNPAPWAHNGQTGWHTNKGITFETFKTYAPVLGYTCDAATFFSMPDDVWNKIFKKVYWDAIDADHINSNVIATYAVSWEWGSGAGGGKIRLINFLAKQSKYVNASQIATALNQLSAAGERTLFEAMLADREKQFIAMNQPANLEGWLGRLNRYRTALSPYITSK